MALELIRKIYLLAKVLNIDEVFNLLGSTLRMNFWLQFPIFSHDNDRFIEFKDYYLLYYDYLCRSNQ